MGYACKNANTEVRRKDYRPLTHRPTTSSPRPTTASIERMNHNGSARRYLQNGRDSHRPGPGCKDSSSV